MTPEDTDISLKSIIELVLHELEHSREELRQAHSRITMLETKVSSHITITEKLNNRIEALEKILSEELSTKAFSQKVKLPSDTKYNTMKNILERYGYTMKSTSPNVVTIYKLQE